MKKLNKYQLGGLSSVLPQLISKRYPEAVRVGTTRPDEFEAMAAGEEGRYKALDYIKSDRYKNILKQELARSKASDYPSGKKPTFDELYNERLTRINNTPIEHLEKSPWSLPYDTATWQGGQAIAYPGSGNKIIGKTYTNPLFEYNKMSIAGIPTQSKADEHVATGLEEAIHNTHKPLTINSNTLIDVFNPRYKEQDVKRKTSPFNLTPAALKTISDNTVPVDKMHSFPLDYYSHEKENKANYSLVPTEIITQIPKVLADTNTKGRFTNKSFKHMIDNPTIGGERLLNATSGSFNPYNQLRDNKKLYRQTMKNTKRIMNNIADVGENDIPIARNGMKVPRIIKPSNISKSMGRPRTNYYRGNVMQNGGVTKGNAIELLKEKHALDNERQMDQLTIPANHRIDTTTPLTQQQKEEINKQVEAKLYNIENGTQWLDDKVKSINKDINLINDMEYLKTANVPIMTNNPGPKYQTAGFQETYSRIRKYQIGGKSMSDENLLNIPVPNKLSESDYYRTYSNYKTPGMWDDYGHYDQDAFGKSAPDIKGNIISHADETFSKYPNVPDTKMNRLQYGMANHAGTLHRWAPYADKYTDLRGRTEQDFMKYYTKEGVDNYNQLAKEKSFTEFPVEVWQQHGLAKQEALPKVRRNMQEIDEVLQSPYFKIGYSNDRAAMQSYNSTPINNTPQEFMTDFNYMIDREGNTTIPKIKKEDAYNYYRSYYKTVLGLSDFEATKKAKEHMDKERESQQKIDSQSKPRSTYQSGGRLKMPILDTQIQNTTQPSFNYNGLKNEGFKYQIGGNIASNQREMAAGLNAGINQFNFPTKGLKKMTMTPESGNITDPVIMEGYTDGSLSDRKIAQPGQSNININADTIIEKPDLTYIDDFNEAYDHADKKKYPIFVWKNGEYPLKQHRKNK